jgi:hypothetical protein
MGVDINVRDICKEDLSGLWVYFDIVERVELATEKVVE